MLVFALSVGIITERDMRGLKLGGRYCGLAQAYYLEQYPPLRLGKRRRGGHRKVAVLLDIS